VNRFVKICINGTLKFLNTKVFNLSFVLFSLLCC